MTFLTLPNMLIVSLTLLLVFLFREMKRLQRNALHRNVGQDIHQVQASQHVQEHGKHPVAIAGTLQARPVVMAAIQEAKTEIMEHFVKKKFKDPNKKELPHLTAS